jgi:hypothetical protein
MKTVWKFPIKIEDVQSIEMPHGAMILHAGLDPTGQPCVWAGVRSEIKTSKQTVYVTGTGHPIPEGPTAYVGSFNQGTFVWHVWIPVKQ